MTSVKMLSDVPAVAIEWPKDTGVVHELLWSRGGLEGRNHWVTVPVLKSVGGGASIFEAKPGIDSESSPEIKLMSTDSAGANWRKKIGVVLFEISAEDLKETRDLQAVLDASGEEFKI